MSSVRIRWPEQKLAVAGGHNRLDSIVLPLELPHAVLIRNTSPDRHALALGRSLAATRFGGPFAQNGDQPSILVGRRVRFTQFCDNLRHQILRNSGLCASGWVESGSFQADRLLIGRKIPPTMPATPQVQLEPPPDAGAGAAVCAIVEQFQRLAAIHRMTLR